MIMPNNKNQTAGLALHCQIDAGRYQSKNIAPR